jgi:hypothetical protein
MKQGAARAAEACLVGAALLLAAPSANAAQAVLRNLSFANGIIQIPELRIEGAKETEAQLEGVLNSALAIGFLAGDFSAKRITAPSVVIGAPGFRVFSFDNLVVTDWQSGTIGSISGSRLSLGFDGGADLSAAALKVDGLRLGAFLRFIDTNNVRLAEAFGENASTWAPVFDSVEVSGLAVSAAIAPFGFGFSASAAKVTAKGHDGVIPGQLAVTAEGLKLDGLTKPGGMALDSTLSYSAATKVLEISRVSLSAPQLGDVTLSARFENLERGGIEGTSDEQLSSWMGVRLPGFSIAIRDAGLIDAVSGQLGAAQAKSAATARQELAGLVRLLVPALVSDPAQSGPVGEAVASFLEKPGAISITAKGRDGGLTAGDVVALEGPKDIISRLDLVVASNP